MLKHIKAPLVAPLVFCVALLSCAPGQKEVAQAPRAPKAKTPQPLPQSKASPSINLDALGDRTVLLVTHPSLLIVRTMHAMMQEKQLAVPKLLVIGLHHAQERERYDRSHAYLKENGIQWMVLHQLTCPISQETLFQSNACSPVFRKLLKHSAGIIFNGGADIPPALYGEKTSLTTVIRTPYRQFWELSFLSQLLGSSRNANLEPLMKRRPGFPVLGICMGLQAMNVATGGTLIQDIPSEVYGVKTFEDVLKLPGSTRHRSAKHRLQPNKVPAPGVYHPLRFTGALELWTKLHPARTPVSVLSVHHQAIEKLGAKLQVIATSTDGKIVEAVKHKVFPHVLGVQFHPEYYVYDHRLRTTGKKGRRVGPEAKDLETLGFHRRFWKRFTDLLKPPCH
ncbi:MAG: gamma-glutamyl-gamma-aminobutyrate hydrolase family protein [Deltaproteobacteria bacterium]|nr:gamma-glutamyl-gamma-aminobutyrate hydrolase family protein [Deltaproteobacteria bacterium]